MSVRIGNRAGSSNVIQSAQLAGFHGNISRTPALYLGTWEAIPSGHCQRLQRFCQRGRTPHAVHRPPYYGFPGPAALRHHQEQAHRLFPAGGEHNLFHSSSRSASPEARQAKLPRWALNPPAAAKPELRIIIRTHGSPDIRPTSPAVSGWGLIPPPKIWKKATEAPWPCLSGWILCLPPRRKAIPPTPSVRVPGSEGQAVLVCRGIQSTGPFRLPVRQDCVF